MLQICKYLDCYRDIKSFLSAIGKKYHESNSPSWYELVKRKAENEWHLGFDRATTELMSTLQLHRFRYWSLGTWVKDKMLNDLKLIVGNFHALSLQGNKNMNVIQRAMIEEGKEPAKTFILIVNIKIANHAAMSGQRLEVCFHLTQNYNYYKEQVNAFAIRSSEWCNASIRCITMDVSQVYLVPTTGQHSPSLMNLLQLGEPCAYCRQHLLENQTGFNYKCGYEDVKYINISPVVVDDDDEETPMNEEEEEESQSLLCT